VRRCPASALIVSPRTFWFLFVPAVGYQLLALLAGLLQFGKQLSHRVPETRNNATPVSVLKPLRGLDPNTYPAFVSQAQQNYPEFELLFGVREGSDPAAAEVRRLQAQFPNVAIHLIVGAPETPNGKVGMLLELARHARHPVWVVNDSDIKVTPDYLSAVTTPLSDASIGVVTCPYRVRAHTLPAFWEALGIATDFMPSTLVAQLVGVREFGFGSTLAFRASDLVKAGGFAAFASYLADDYQLAKSITSLGRLAIISSYVVETSLGEATWSGVWLHQLRWARTIRLTKGAGFAGLPVTHAGLWILLAASTGAYLPAIALAALRVCSAFVTGGLVLRSFPAAVCSWLAPLWDLYSFAVWLASYAGREVSWRDQKLHIDAKGRIVS
jgi:ceramide glucosyltransferase